MKYIHLYLISYSDLSTVMWKFMKNKTILYSPTKNVGKDVIANHHTDREKEPAKQLFHKTLMRREGKKSDSAVKRQKFDKLVVQTIGLDAHKKIVLKSYNYQLL